jgi:AcrR family transcriptional regulator
MRNPSPPLTTKQTEIADAALKVIGERGIAALTTASLAQELGVSSGAPFRHFTSREEILEAAAQRVAALVEAAYPDPALAPLERLRALFLARVDTVGHRAGVARFIFSDQFALALPPAAVERMLDLVRGTRAFVLAALVEAGERGEVRQDLPAEALVPIVMGSLQHLVFLTALPPGLGKPPRADELFANLACLLAPLGSKNHDQA